MDASAAVPPPYVAAPLHLHPFRAHVLQASRVGDPAAARLFARPYRAVAERFGAWREKGHLTSDTGTAVYLHEYTASGITVRGWVGALDLTRRVHGPEDRGVLPHEGVHPEQTTELADRMAEIRIDPAPILLLHRAAPELADLTRRVASRTPTWELQDRAEQRHRIWAVRDEVDQSVLNASLGRALLADGHHRYAAYLQLQARHPGSAADHGLVMVVDQHDTPLFLGPIHRVLVGTTLDDLVAGAERAGLPTREVTSPGYDHLAAATAVATDGERAVALPLPVTSEHEPTMVERIHRDLVPALAHAPREVLYRHSVEETVNALRTHQGVALLLPAPTYEQVLATAEAGRLLPEKATSFQPKPSVGLLMRSLVDEPAAHR